MSRRFRVMVLGGYGRFGAVISRQLAADPRMQVCVAGRDPGRATALAAEIGADGRGVDLAADLWTRVLGEWQPDLLVSCAGPFQGQGYAVARAAIAAGVHYADLADARDFVCGIGQLDAAARGRDCLVVAGASSVPTLTGAVIDELRPRFAKIASIEMGISTSSRIPGEATVRAALSYSGRPFDVWEQGARAQRHGWQGLRRHRFHGAGMTRWVCDCDVPDLQLFPSRYGADTVRFGAGTERLASQLGLWVLSWAGRLGLQPVRLAPVLVAAGRRMEWMGTGRSALFVRLRGVDGAGKGRQEDWELVAEDEHGSDIPAMAAVALARKLASGAVSLRGAMPCVGLVSLSEYLAELSNRQVRVHQATSPLG